GSVPQCVAYGSGLHRTLAPRRSGPGESINRHEMANVGRSSDLEGEAASPSAWAADYWDLLCAATYWNVRSALVGLRQFAIPPRCRHRARPANAKPGRNSDRALDRPVEPPALCRVRAQPGYRSARH